MSQENPTPTRIIQEAGMSAVNFRNRRTAVLATFRRGEMPPLQNFRFVIDRRPAGQEEDSIPVRIFNSYLTRREIPIADIDHRYHGHDTYHVPTYQDMLAFLSFADLLQHAAILSDESEASALETVDALDKLGDALGDLAMGKRLARYTGQAARSLAKLVEIGCTDIDSRPELYASLHADLGIGSYETLAGFRPTSDYLGLIALRPTQT